MDELNQSNQSTVAFVTLINLNYINDNDNNVLPCPHTNCSHCEQSMCGITGGGEPCGMGQ